MLVATVTPLAVIPGFSIRIGTWEHVFEEEEEAVEEARRILREEGGGMIRLLTPTGMIRDEIRVVQPRPSSQGSKHPQRSRAASTRATAATPAAASTRTAASAPAAAAAAAQTIAKQLDRTGTAVSPVTRSADELGDALSRVAVVSSTIPDVLEPEEVVFFIDDRPLGRQFLDVETYRLRRSGDQLLGVERHHETGLWVRSQVLRGEDDVVWLLASLDGVMEPFWEAHNRSPRSLEPIRPLCPNLMMALATEQVAIRFNGAPVTLEVRPTGDGRTFVGTTFVEEVFSEVSGRVLVGADLITDVVFHLFAEVLIATAMLGQKASKADWLKTVGEGADVVKKIFDALSSIQGFMGALN